MSTNLYKNVVDRDFKWKKQLKTILNSGALMPNGQVRLTKPLYVFKKVYSGKGDPVIANLVIPIGADVNVAYNVGHKFRASQAYCYSLVYTNMKRRLENIHSAVSGHKSNFRYFSGKEKGLQISDFKDISFNHEKYIHRDKTKRQGFLECKVVPNRFDYTSTVCSAGVHFFVDVQNALDW